MIKSDKGDNRIWIDQLIPSVFKFLTNTSKFLQLIESRSKGKKNSHQDSLTSSRNGNTWCRLYKTLEQ